MFRIDLKSNRLTRLEERRFADLNIRERSHLQEWFANMPDALGEPLLIIQKEFDGFDETRERLDLLALDKEGQLVLIENKLDDSGRDVVWQAIKYAAYVSTLSKAQIVEIFQQYLDKHCGGGNATERIREFLGSDEFDEVVLNPRSSQRIILIAANFRREITATALWLLSRGIPTQCFTVTPFLHGDDVLVDVRQIIPVSEASDYMMGVALKENDERISQQTQKTRHIRRLKFWSQVLERFRGSSLKIYNGISPSQDNWLSAGCGISGCHYAMIFGLHEARVELIFARARADENRQLFDQLYERRAELEESFGYELDWDRGPDERKKAIIRYSADFDGLDEAAWPEIVEWLLQHMGSLERTFGPVLSVVGQRLKQSRG